MKQDEEISKAKELNILVVGDWVIDENWLVASHNPVTSTHSGKEHFRSLVTNLDSQIISLCGAGNVARSLHGLSNWKSLGEGFELDKTLSIHGLGIWQPDDTRLLASLFSSDKILDNETPHTLTGIRPKTAITIEEDQFSLCSKSLKDASTPCKKESCPHGEHEICSYLWSLAQILDTAKQKEIGTTRMIRVYKHGERNDPKLMYRFDWEKRYSYNEIYEKLKKMQPQPNTGEKPKPFIELTKKMDAIVVADINKGVVTSELILYLKERYPDADWYVRSKVKKPVWLDEINDEKFRLLVVGADLTTKQSNIHRWAYGLTPPMELIHDLIKMGNLDPAIEKNRTVSALINENKTLTIIQQGRSLTGYIIEANGETYTIDVGRSSIFFSSLVSSMLGCYDNKYTNFSTSTNDNALKRLKVALIHASRWTKECTDSFMKKEDRIHLRGDYSKALHFPTETVSYNIEKILSIEEERLRWDESKTDLGLINNRFFQIWRGISPIDNYISIRKHKREEIGNLLNTVKQFKSDPNPIRSLNCYLTASPGWGKTFLAKSLAKMLDMTFMSFNITHMTSIDNIIDCLDTISSAQNQQPDTPILVFIDEINAEIAGSNIYAYFLSPIWDGVFKRGAATFKLRPCVWIFAGTESLDEIRENGKEVKGSDFSSRINGPKIKLDLSEDDIGKFVIIEEQKTEQIYLGISILKRKYADILSVTKGILYFFHEIKPKFGIRSMEYISEKFNNIQYDEVNDSNLPDYSDILNQVDNDIDEYNKIKSKCVDYKENIKIDFSWIV